MFGVFYKGALMIRKSTGKALVSDTIEVVIVVAKKIYADYGKLPEVKQWVEEFGGGEWQVAYSAAEIMADAEMERLREDPVYGGGYQAPRATRATLGIWK